MTLSKSEERRDDSTGSVHDWNVVIAVLQRHLEEATDFLRPLGQVSKAEFFNVLVMKVGSIDLFLPDLSRALQAQSRFAHLLQRIMPAMVCFDFQHPREFEAKAANAVEPWVGRLANSSFQVRMHRRGFKGRLSSQDEEGFLDRVLMRKLSQQGAETRIDFQDPDFIIDIQTVGQRAGLGIWTREQALRYPFLKLD